MVVLILINSLAQAQTRQRELIGRISYLENQIYQLELSMTGQRRYRANQLGGWGWLLALVALVVLAFTFLA